MIRALALGVLVAAALPSCRSEEPPPAPAPKQAPKSVSAPARLPAAAELVKGPLPSGPQADVAHSQCTVCHTDEYLVQQRLSPAAWQKTIAKMQKFGANVSDEQATKLAAWLSSLYTPDLPVRPAPLVEIPAAALPSAP